jgi:hypothetical protein
MVLLCVFELSCGFAFAGVLLVKRLKELSKRRRG